MDSAQAAVSYTERGMVPTVVGLTSLYALRHGRCSRQLDGPEGFCTLRCEPNELLTAG